MHYTQSPEREEKLKKSHDHNADTERHLPKSSNL